MKPSEILLVDVGHVFDEQRLALLRGSQLAIDQARSTQAALAMAESKRYAAHVVTALDDSRGVAVLKLLRQRNKDAIGIGLVEDRGLGLVADLINGGALELILAPPHTPTRLVRLLRQALELHWQRHDEGTFTAGVDRVRALIANHRALLDEALACVSSSDGARVGTAAASAVGVASQLASLHDEATASVHTVFAELSRVRELADSRPAEQPTLSQALTDAAEMEAAKDAVESASPPVAREEQSQLRQQARVPMATEARILCDRALQRGVSEDVSEGGVFVACDAPPAVGTRLTVAFTLPGENHEVRSAAEVKWVRPGGDVAWARRPGVGLSFLEPAADDVDAIRTFVRDWEREGDAQLDKLAG